jgi:UDP:flavonoid glycosyltransferase YjiC (YdhE family)
LLDEADLCVGHGGPGFATAALLAGVPLVILPRHVEQERIAARLRDEGLAHIADASDLADTLRAALADTAMRARARDFARGHAAARRADVAGEVAARLVRLLG